MLVGAALLVNGVRGWMTRQASDDLPWWDQYIQDVTPAKALRLTHARALRLALLLSVANPKILLLATAAGLTNSAAGLTPAVTVATTVALTLLASSSVAAPVLLSIGARVLRFRIDNSSNDGHPGRQKPRVRGCMPKERHRRWHNTELLSQLGGSGPGRIRAVGEATWEGPLEVSEGVSVRPRSVQNLASSCFTRFSASSTKRTSC